MKKFFAHYVLTVLAVAAGITSAKAGTIAHWTFEEGTPGLTASGTGTIIDIAGGNNGTAIDGPTYVGGAISGYGSTGLNFDGGLDTVRVISGSTLPDALGSTAPLTLAGDFTIEICMTADAAGGGPCARPQRHTRRRTPIKTRSACRRRRRTSARSVR